MHVSKAKFVLVVSQNALIANLANYFLFLEKLHVTFIFNLPENKT